MVLNSPFKISSRLLPCVEIDGATISLEYSGNLRGRGTYRWYFDHKELGEFSSNDLQSGMGGASLQDMFGTLFCFMSACGESYRYKMANPNSEPENLDLFPEPMREWCYRHSDELTILELECEESENLIEE